MLLLMSILLMASAVSPVRRSRPEHLPTLALERGRLLLRLHVVEQVSAERL